MLDFLLYPKSVAIVGASRNPGKVGHVVVSNILEGGYEGEVVLVNSKADEILGLKCYKSLTEYDGKVDLAVIVVPARVVKDAIQDSIRAGVKAVCVISAGFKESNSEGVKLQEEISSMCRSAGVRLLGPNVVGIINTHHKLNAAFAMRMPIKGGISVVSQSGAICAILLDWAYGRKIGLANLISIGNKGDLDEIDFIEALSNDDKTKVIVGFLEDIKNGKAFIKAARTVAHKKPIVLLKAGISESGAKAAHSHTGSLAGADIAYGAAFKRSGIIRADSIIQLLDFGIAFAMQPLPDGDNVAIVTNAGGPGITTADAIENAGLKVKPLSKEITDMLREKLPASASVGNPINVRMDASAELYIEALNAAQDDQAVDTIVCLCAPQAMTPPNVLAKLIVENARGEKPLLAVFMGDYDMKEARDELMENNIPSYETPTRAAATLRAMRDYALWLKCPPRVVTRFSVNRQRVERIISRHMKIGQLQVGEADAKDILRAYDFAVPPGQIAHSAEESVEAASRIGYPVVMKIVSLDILHKSDFGAVRLNLANPQEVEDAFDFIMMRVKRKAPDARIEGVYIEKMCSRGMEIILGMNRDPQFGPMLMFGLGGIHVEVMKDVSFHLAPITADDAMQMIKSTRSYDILKGARGEAGVDLDSIAVALQRISQLVTDFPEIQELDINPFIAGEVGAEPFVADARMILSEAGKES